MRYLILPLLIIVSQLASAEVPECNRYISEPEEIELSEIIYVGQSRIIMENKEYLAANILLPNSKSFTLVVGDHIGKNHGLIKSIHSDRIEIAEVVPDNICKGWVERINYLTIQGTTVSQFITLGPIKCPNT